MRERVPRRPHLRRRRTVSPGRRSAVPRRWPGGQIPSSHSPFRGAAIVGTVSETLSPLVGALARSLRSAALRGRRSPLTSNRRVALIPFPRDLPQRRRAALAPGVCGEHHVPGPDAGRAIVGWIAGPAASAVERQMPHVMLDSSCGARRQAAAVELIASWISSVVRSRDDEPVTEIDVVHGSSGSLEETARNVHASGTPQPRVANTFTPIPETEVSLWVDRSPRTTFPDALDPDRAVRE
jgi:hypothetical protein